ncbi:MAG: 6-pyruvoyl tetrahydropterin synthase family protein [Planctomycetota bacterium]
MRERYEVKVTKDFLVFSAAHFITFNGNICERLHGHNYRVAVEVAGELDENHYVFDFIALRDLTKEIVDRLDHRVLLPDRSDKIQVTREGSQITARFEDRLWSFPVEDCFLLPVPNTTAELLARWIGQELHASLSQSGHAVPAITRVRVEENFGQWGICELDNSQ